MAICQLVEDLGQNLTCFPSQLDKGGHYILSPSTFGKYHGTSEAIAAQQTPS
jgi:hypothetical protein